MDAKEKYYKFIVDDLVKKTDIIDEYDSHREVNLRFISTPFSKWTYFKVLPTYNDVAFVKYARSRYGVRDEEFQVLWGLYKERIEKLMKK